MRRVLLLICALGLSCFARAASLTVGAPAPMITAKLLDSPETMQVGGASGKVTIVNFWATWCEPCRAEMPAIQAYYDKHKAQGLQVLAISMDKPNAIDKVRQVARQFTFPVAMQADADFKGLGRIWRMPSTFIIDANGILRRNGSEGEPTVDEASLEASVTPLLSRE